MGHHMQKQQHT